MCVAGGRISYKEEGPEFWCCVCIEAQADLEQGGDAAVAQVQELQLWEGRIRGLGLRGRGFGLSLCVGGSNEILDVGHVLVLLCPRSKLCLQGLEWERFPKLNVPQGVRVERQRPEARRGCERSTCNLCDFVIGEFQFDKAGTVGQGIGGYLPNVVVVKVEDNQSRQGKA